MFRRTVAALVLGAALVGGPLAVTSAGAESARPSPRTSSRIAFASFAIDQQAARGFGPTIFTVNPDGSDLQPVGRGGWPEWSPSGRQLAFQDASRKLWDIGVMGVSGTDRRRLAQDGFAPHWSPDGTRIAFSRPPRRSGIYVVSARGGKPRLLIRDGWFPSWSPDGSRILYLRYPDSAFMPRLYTIKPDGSDQQLIRRGRYTFAEWSPDGSRIAALAGTSVYVMNADGSGLRRLPTKIYSKNADCSLAWSPDGGSIAFTPKRGGGVYLMSIKGGRGHRLPGTTDACGVSWAH
jgi:Tol biopolymer transport system component